MTQESLEDFLTKLRFSRRYMLFIGRRCRESSISAVAQEQGLDWKTVKDLDIKIAHYINKTLSLIAGLS